MTGSRKTVLWVDDEIEMLRAHIMFLETRGYHVVPTFSGDDALQLIQEKGGEFDIVLLDEQMPGKDGLTTLEEIKRMKPDLPVVMVTKSEEEHLMEQALGMKIDGYLTKPVNPSQILLVCKRLLDSPTLIASEVRQRFLRSYSENTTALRGSLEVQQWVRLHETLSRWDNELDKIDDEGLRQTHAAQKSDSNASFASFIEEEYGHWIRGANRPPVLSTSVLGRWVFPLLDRGPVYCIICSGMRLDQYLGFEETVRRYFNIQRNYFFAILPTDTPFARRALLAGAFPLAIEERFPDAWNIDESDPAAVAKFEERLLMDQCERADLKLGGGVAYARMTEAEAFHAELEHRGKKRFVVIVADFVNLLTKSGTSTAIAHEIARDERALRSMTRAWFENSQLLRLLRDLSRRKCTVVFTSDHGIVFCTRKTELYGAKKLEYGLRYKFGKLITADERRVVVLNDPHHFNLPRVSRSPACVIAKENYYFSHPESAKDQHLGSRNSFQQGGISMEEMIMPLAVCTPL